MAYGNRLSILGVGIGKVRYIKKAAIPIFLLILFLFSVYSCKGVEEEESIFMKKGQSYFETGDYSLARMQFKQAARVDPTMAEAYYWLGLTDTRLGNVKQALGFFLRVLALNPKHADSQIQIGKIMLDAGFPDKAIQRANLVLGKDEGNRSAIKLKADALLRLDPQRENAKTAGQIYENLLKSGKTTTEIYFQSATALIKQNRLKEAQVRLAEGLAIHPKDASLYDLLAEIYVRRREQKNAIRTYRRLISMAPKKQDYVFKLTELLWASGQKEEAQKLLAQRMHQVGTADESAWIHLARFYAEKKEFALSKNTLLAGLQIHPKSFELSLAYSKVLIHKKEYFAVISILYPALQMVQNKPGTQLQDAQLLLAESFLATGELALAEQFADAYLAKHSQNEKAHFIKGRIFLLNNAPYRAIAELWHVLEVNAADDSARILLTKAMTRTEQWQEAAEILSQGIHSQENHPVLRKELFQLYWNQKKYDRAEAQLKDILADTPNDYDAMLKLADYYQMIGQRTKATQIYDEILRRNRKMPDVYLQLSRRYVKAKNPARAIELLQNGSDTVQESDEILHTLIDLCIREGKYGPALKQVKKRLQDAPSDLPANLLLSRIYLAQREYGKSERTVQKVISNAPDSAEAQTLLMEIWYHQNRKDRIVSHFKSEITERPELVAPFAALARFYVKEAQYAKAITVYESIPLKNDADILATVELVTLLCNHPRSNADREEALRLAKQALKHAFSDPLVLNSLAWAYYRNGDLNLALGYLYHILDQTPNFPSALFHLAKVSLAAGRTKEAAVALERFLALDEDLPEENEAVTLLRDLRAKQHFKGR